MIFTGFLNGWVGATTGPEKRKSQREVRYMDKIAILAKGRWSECDE
jgi:hypothetical protein